MMEIVDLGATHQANVMIVVSLALYLSIQTCKQPICTEEQ
jgi:hypothetical protein